MQVSSAAPSLGSAVRRDRARAAHPPREEGPWPPPAPRALGATPGWPCSQPCPRVSTAPGRFCARETGWHVTVLRGHPGRSRLKRNPASTHLSVGPEGASAHAAWSRTRQLGPQSLPQLKRSWPARGSPQEKWDGHLSHLSPERAAKPGVGESPGPRPSPSTPGRLPF